MQEASGRRVETNQPPATKVLDVGIRSMDLQHQELFSLLSQLNALHKVGKSQQALDEVMPQLQNYALFHFSEEEDLMQALIGCEEVIQAHYLQHQAFVHQLDRLIVARGVNALDDDLVVRLASFLESWLVNHINTADRDVARLLLTQFPALRNQ